jgi:hypothetical protein
VTIFDEPVLVIDRKAKREQEDRMFGGNLMCSAGNSADLTRENVAQGITRNKHNEQTELAGIGVTSRESSKAERCVPDEIMDFEPDHFWGGLKT